MRVVQVYVVATLLLRTLGIVISVIWPFFFQPLSLLSSCDLRTTVVKDRFRNNRRKNIFLDLLCYWLLVNGPFSGPCPCPPPYFRYKTLELINFPVFLDTHWLTRIHIYEKHKNGMFWNPMKTPTVKTLYIDLGEGDDFIYSTKQMKN